MSIQCPNMKCPGSAKINKLRDLEGMQRFVSWDYQSPTAESPGNIKTSSVLGVSVSV